MEVKAVDAPAEDVACDPLGDVSYVLEYGSSSSLRTVTERPSNNVATDSFKISSMNAMAAGDVA
jgi:hypothetical protein